MERNCKTCIYFVPYELDPRFGWCVAVVPREEVRARGYCGLYWPVPWADAALGAKPPEQVPYASPDGLRTW